MVFRGRVHRMAKETELTFITADRRLYERVRDLDFVKFIGEM